MPTDNPSRKPIRIAPALSAEYHKARKQLMLWAAILFIWELVGIDIEKAQEAGGNAGAVIKAIKSPQAVPWVLLILVCYFAFKCWIEWHQCSPERKKILAARIDVGSAWLVALAAVVLYGFQVVSRVQFADALQNSVKVKSTTLGALAGSIIVLSVFIPVRFNERLKVLKSLVLFFVAPVVFAVGVLIFKSGLWPYKLLGLTIGSVVMAGFVLLVSRQIDRSLG